MMKNLDLNLLSVFDAVLEEGSITRAAERLELSQPALSNALARLRKATGDRLFVRTPRGMAPTPYAERLARAVRPALGDIRQALEEGDGFDPATSQRCFTLYLTDLGEAYFLPRLLPRLAERAPGVRIRTLPMPARNPQEALESGEVDLAVGNLPDLKAGFYQQRLFRVHYVCMVRHGHPLIGERLSARAFAEATHAVVAPAGTGHHAVEAMMVEKGLQHRIGLRVQNFLVLPLIVATTDFIALVPHPVAEQHWHGVDLRLFKPPHAVPPFDIKQCWHERFHDDAGNRWLRQLLAETFLTR